MATLKQLSVSYTEYEKIEELGNSDIELITAAREACLNAYAPYSGFKVGAAVRLESGIIIKGANVENSAFPSGICAERNAIFNSSTNHPDDNIVSLAIASMRDNAYTEIPPSPCGNCRQVISEEEARSSIRIRIILSGETITRVIEGIENLLPLQFTRTNLGTTLP